MELINNRYRIIKNINQTSFLSSYEAYDMSNNKEKIMLNIFNPDYFTSDMVKYGSNNIFTIYAIDSPYIIKIFEFNRLYIIDNKKTNNNQYFYTNEIINEKNKLKDIAKFLNEDEIIDIFMQVCKGVNYLHSIGLYYGEINIDNILVENENDNIKIKLRDLFGAEIEKQEYWTHNKTYGDYKAPEIQNGATYSKLSDVYALGILLTSLYFKNLDGKIKFCKETLKSKELKIYEIIQKMTSYNADNRYSNIDNVVSDINFVLGKNYDAFCLEDFNKINFHIPLIGRKKELDIMQEHYERVQKYKEDGKIILIHGEDGIGKTRLLEEIKFVLNIEKSNIYWNFNNDLVKSNNNQTFIEIFRKILSFTEKELMEEYRKEFSRIFLNLDDNGGYIPLIEDRKDKYRIMNRICSFLNNFSHNQPIVFIIDNFHLADRFSIEMFEYIYQNSNINRNIIFIITYRDSELKNNRGFNECINGLKDKSIDLCLYELSIKESKRMIDSMLMAPAPFDDLKELIIKETGGNPLFISEVLKELQLRRTIYFDINKGSWTKNRDSSSDIPISSSVEQAVLNQLKEIPESLFCVLNGISIFNKTVSANTLKAIINKNEEEVDIVIDELLRKGILSCIIDNEIYMYGINNRILKELLYNRINDEERKNYHKLAAKFMEQQYIKSGEADFEELIYHFEQAGQKDKLIKYCTYISKKMEKQNDNSYAIEYLKKVAICFQGSDLYSLCKIYIHIGDLFLKNMETNNSIIYYKKAEKISEIYSYLEENVKAINKLTNIYIYMNDTETAKILNSKAKRYLKVLGYSEVYLECIKQQILICINSHSYEEAKDLIRCNLEICGDIYIKEKGYLYNLEGIIFYETCKISKAMISYEKALKIFRSIDYNIGVSKVLNNMCIVYNSYYQDTEKSIEYLKEVVDICKRDGSVFEETIVSLNMGNNYALNAEYEEALNILTKTLEMTCTIKHEVCSNYCYENLFFINSKFGRLNEAFEYYHKCEDIFESNILEIKETAQFFYFGAYLFSIIGEYTKSEKYIEKSLDLYGEDNSKFKWDCEILREINYILQNDNVSNSTYKIIELSSNYRNKLNKVEIIYDTCLALNQILLINEGKKLFMLLNKGLIHESINSKIVELKGKFLQAFYNRGESYLTELKEVYKLAKECNENIIYTNICIELGDAYLEEFNYFNAINYYYEACEKIKEVSKAIPEGSDIQFINNHNFLRPFIKLRKINGAISDNLVLKDGNDVKALFEYKDIKDILSNENFLKIAKKRYNNYSSFNSFSVEDILINLKSNSLENIKFMIGYISSYVLANKAFLAVQDKKDKFKILYSFDYRNEIEDYDKIIQKLRIINKPTVVKEHNQKYFISIPINMNDFYSKSERRNKNLSGDILGHLYFETDKMINNFNKESLNQCIKLEKLIGLNIEKYLLRLNSCMDKLTEVYNRKFMEDCIDENIELSNSTNKKFTIIMLDLDDFKNINDRFGHEVGDNVLKRVCNNIKSTIRDKDFCCRYGGEEFVIILPDCGIVTGEAIAERIRSNIEKEKILGDKRSVTVSMGLCSYPEYCQWKEELIDKADRALYVAKEKGKNRCQVWKQSFENKQKVANKLAGIITGNAVQDYRNILNIIEITDLLKKPEDKEKKIYDFLGRMIEITESNRGIVFIMNKDSIKEIFARKIYSEGWAIDSHYNNDLVRNVFESKKGIYMIDWNDDYTNDINSSIPDWQSVIVIPMMKEGITKGVFYLSVSIKIKEFKYEDYNYINFLSKIAAEIL